MLCPECNRSGATWYGNRRVYATCEICGGCGELKDNGTQASHASYTPLWQEHNESLYERDYGYQNKENNMGYKEIEGLLKQTVERLSQPVQYTADVNDFRELSYRVAILRADAMSAKGLVEKALDIASREIARANDCYVDGDIKELKNEK